MKTYSPSQFDPQQAIRDGAYQSWTFGPNLLDEYGKVPETFNTWGYIRKAHPRTMNRAITASSLWTGGKRGYSRGMTLPELAQVFEGLGCSATYNLDGGHSSFMALGEQVINCPYRPDHKIVDCLYFGEG